MKVIAVTNRKGGVGKTTVATHIAAGLAIGGARVGLVDTDSQGHAGLMFGVQSVDGLYDLLVNQVPLQDAVYHIEPEVYADLNAYDPTGDLYVIPSWEMTYQIPHTRQAENAFTFYRHLKEFGKAYNLDVIIIDTNPTLSAFDAQTYLTTDGFVYVTECERLAFEGISAAVDQMELFAADRREFLNQDTEIIGIVPNKLIISTNIHRANASALAQAFEPGLVWSPVRRLTVWAEATELGQVLFKYAPGDESEKEAWGFVKSTEEWLQKCQRIEAMQ